MSLPSKVFKKEPLEFTRALLKDDDLKSALNEVIALYKRGYELENVFAEPIRMLYKDIERHVITVKMRPEREKQVRRVKPIDMSQQFIDEQFAGNVTSLFNNVILTYRHGYEIDRVRIDKREILSGIPRQNFVSVWMKPMENKRNLPNMQHQR